MMNWQARILPHFALWEGGLIILYSKLLFALGKTRLHYDDSIHVNSWTRCWEWNNHEGGKDDSYHMNGHAIDITGDDLDRLERCARKFFVFVLRYDTFLHCSVQGKRPKVVM